MRNSFWAYWLILLGVMIVVVMLLVNNITTSTTQDYYLIKEITEASLIDAIDYSYYRTYGELKINKEKFYESFIRRFSETASLNTTYTVSFYGVYETPPKVSVEIKSSSSSFSVMGDATSVEMVERIDSILEGSQLESTSATGTSAVSCTTSTQSSELAGMGGVAMVSTTMYSSTSGGSSVGTAVAGQKFTIAGGNSDNSMWLIDYNGTCGWVNANSMAINLADYIKTGISFDIYNASSAQYMSSGETLPGITGEQMYDTSYYTNSWVPSTWSFAQKLKKACASAAAAGDTIVINDAYRPYTVTTALKASLQYLYDNDSIYPNVKANIDKYGYGTKWFLAQGTSMHNRGCAVDAQLAGYSDYPSAMHELSVAAIIYSGPSSSYGYTSAFSNSDGATRLHEYMKNAGLGDLASEWWHYQDNDCSVSSAANFWYSSSWYSKFTSVANQYGFTI